MGLENCMSIQGLGVRCRGREETPNRNSPQDPACTSEQAQCQAQGQSLAGHHWVLYRSQAPLATPRNLANQALPSQVCQARNLPLLSSLNSCKERLQLDSSSVDLGLTKEPHLSTQWQLGCLLQTMSGLSVGCLIISKSKGPPRIRLGQHPQ